MLVASCAELFVSLAIEKVIVGGKEEQTKVRKGLHLFVGNVDNLRNPTRARVCKVSPDHASRAFLTPVQVGRVVVGASVTRPTIKSDRWWAKLAMMPGLE